MISKVLSSAMAGTLPQNEQFDKQYLLFDAQFEMCRNHSSVSQKNACGGRGRKFMAVGVRYPRVVVYKPLHICAMAYTRPCLYSSMPTCPYKQVLI
jgi:hypothetical protein